MRRSRLLVALTIQVTVVSAAPASAGVPHTVQPGETLWSIAAANNFTTRSLAAANGLSEDSQVVLGSTIQIPSVAEAASALAAQGVPQAAPASQAAPVVQAAAPASPAPPPQGGYTVRAGDSLSAIAARSGISTSQLAWMNGLDPAKPLLIGTVLKLPAGAAAPAPAAPAPAATVVPQAAPNPAPGRVTAAQIGQIATAHGVSPSLAAAVAWQESGFNNGLVSSANARGVMQILPGTWTWIQDTLAEQQLDPSSPLENVHAGVMYLDRLTKDAGGDPATAVAAYYQGLSSVQRDGMFPETRRYVDNVMALRGRFGGN